MSKTNTGYVKKHAYWLPRCTVKIPLLVICAVIVIICANALTFWGQYSGTLIFPWDFMSSVSHAQAVAWFEDGSILRPPTWLPYGSMGFPGWWSIQSGGWYLPLQLISWLEIKYTLFFSAAFQAAHVAVGAIGVLVLLRTLGASLSAATLAALIYHFSSTFFSNQQHVEFVRAAALLPWVLWSLHPSCLLGRRAATIWASLLIWQFLIASYPGVIVSGGITVAFVVLWWLFTSPTETRRAYSFAVGIAGCSGVLMAMLKWLTPALLALGGLQAKTPVFSFQPEHLFTFLFRYDLPILSQDPTMQSLWLPPLALLLVVFARRGSPLLWLGAGVALLAFVAGSLETFAPWLRRAIPGFTISRQHHADWRPMLHLGIAIVSAALFDGILRERFNTRELLLRAGLSAGAVFLIAIGAIKAGYSFGEIRFELAIFFAFLGSVAGSLFLFNSDQDKNFRKYAILVAAVVLIASTSFLQHFVHVTRTWQNPWGEENERAYFGDTVGNLIKRPRQVEWPRRPARSDYGADPRTLAGQLDLRFNRAWYAQEFATFGYDNLGSAEFKRFMSYFADTSRGDRLLAFMRHPGQVFFHTPKRARINFSAAAACPPERESCASSVQASARILSYRLDGGTYLVEAGPDVMMIENEMWYPGWVGSLCDEAGRCQKLRPYATEGNLRAWSIPAGNWRLSTTYIQPFFRSSVVLFGIGLATPILYVLFFVRRRQKLIDAR